MKLSFLTLMFYLLITPAVMASDSPAGTVTGGVIYETPDWFKSSFLDFSDDIDEAKSQGKHVMAFMHLDECPYCDRMLKENFMEGDSKNFMQTHFDVIGVNIEGDLDVTWIDGKSYTEKELKEHLNAIATPTMVFLNLDGDKVLQLNGYRDPRAFRYALEYVQEKRYVEVPFSDYLAQLKKPEVYSFKSHPYLQKVNYFKDFKQPLFVLFEDKQCAECDRFHEKTLNHPDVLQAMDGFMFVRLDTDSKKKLVDLNGRTITPAQWANDLGLSYRPALVLFNSGEEKYRADGIHYHHHLSEALIYTNTGHLEHASLRDFKTAYREGLLSSGKNVDFSE